MASVASAPSGYRHLKGEPSGPECPSRADGLGQVGRAIRPSAVARLGGLRKNGQSG